MAKDIDRFITELADYINRFIAGKENSYIKECVVSDKVYNRGHIIPIKVKVPEWVDEKITALGPGFYAEELMEEFPDHTVAFIAEVINARVTEFYPGLVEIFTEKAKNMNKTIEEYAKQDIIVSAVPSSQVSENDRQAFITRDLEDVGLTLIMKACIGDNPTNPNQSYFCPIMNKGRKVTEEDWKNAECNTLQSADINIIGMPAPSGAGEPIPLCGSIIDIKNFCDFFYLLNPRRIWKDIADKSSAEKIIIIPRSIYSAIFVVDNEFIRNNPSLSAVRDEFANLAMNTAEDILPVYELDCSTWKIKQVEVEK